MHCTKLLSKVCVEQHLKAPVNARDEAHIYLHYSCVLACHFNRLSNDTRTTHELHAKTNGKHVSMMHTSVKVKIELYCMYTQLYIIKYLG